MNAMWGPALDAEVAYRAERLRAASGSAMLPDEQAEVLVEVFDVLQRLRLRHQLRQHRQRRRPSDVLLRAEVSPIDRSVTASSPSEGSTRSM